MTHLDLVNDVGKIFDCRDVVASVEELQSLAKALINRLIELNEIAYDFESDNYYWLSNGEIIK